ncbi:hypothetical protein F511_24899 [Dorcoceras hygrometricum]|uniref:Uncharacterized protein n=1 Tax=Dorcoceras hygrometricum TaxID=472368 RepID=A0A2Z7ABH8_9LAMI|nr:hypothetical protein F511_24899 [Dorcoceras hygrometricum]
MDMGLTQVHWAGSSPYSTAAPPCRRRRDRTCSDRRVEEIPFVSNSSGLLLQAYEGVTFPVVDLIKEDLPPPTVKSQNFLANFKLPLRPRETGSGFATTPTINARNIEKREMCNIRDLIYPGSYLPDSKQRFHFLGSPFCKLINIDLLTANIDRALSDPFLIVSMSERSKLLPAGATRTRSLHTTNILTCTRFPVVGITTPN